MHTLGAGRILIKSIIIVRLLNLMAWKASWAHRTGENEKKDNDKIKKSVQTSSPCGLWCADKMKTKTFFFLGRLPLLPETTIG